MKSVQLEAWLAHRKASEPQLLPHEEAYGKPRPEEGNSRLPGRGKVKFMA